jgi:periplasmic protein TonB
MAPLTKDSVEVASPSADAAAPQTSTSTKPASGLRSDALSLEVAVKVHGSRVIEVARGTAPQTEPFEEQTVTMIVFPQGAVLRMSTAVNVSQMLVLTNIKTKQDSICRVLKVRPNANQGSYVEVEFTHRQPGYWGVNFPSEATVSATPSATRQINSEVQGRPPAAPIPVVPVAPVVKAVTPTPMTREVASIATPAAPPKPESTFISIGSQESVQDAASATDITRPLSPVERRLQNPGPPVASSNTSTVATDVLPEPVPPAPSMEDLLGDTGSSSSGTISVSEETDSSSAAEATAVSATSSFAAADSATSHSAASESFGARLDSSFGAAPARDAGSNQNWMLIAASVAVLVAALGAGVVYFRQHPANGTTQSAAAAHNAVSASQPVGDSSNQLPAITPTNQPYMPAASDPNSPARSNANTSNVSTAPVAMPTPIPATQAKTPAPSANRPVVAAAKPSAPGVTTDMVSNSLTARPTTSTRGDQAQADQAPTLDPAVAASNPGALAGIAPTTAASLPSPEMSPEGPVKIGGNVKEPKLISSPLPQYPLAARSSGQQGDVVVETTIDKSGSVVRMHVVSGPSSLRSAAMDALRRWKYEPSRLDGEPVEVQMLVTIKFRL